MKPLFRIFMSTSDALLPHDRRHNRTSNSVEASIVKHELRLDKSFMSWSVTRYPTVTACSLPARVTSTAAAMV